MPSEYQTSTRIRKNSRPPSSGSAAVLRGLCIGLIMLAMGSQAQADDPLSARLNLYKDAIDAVGAAGDAIAKLTDGVKHLVVTGTQGYDYVAAKRDHDRLRDLSARATDLAFTQNASVLSSIDAYLAIKNPSEPDWDAVRHGTQGVIDSVKRLLDDVRKERSDFVLEDAYGKLGASLESRGLILGKLSALPQPQTAEERKALKQLNDKYKILVANFKDAITELNAYLKSKPAPNAGLSIGIMQNDV